MSVRRPNKTVVKRLHAQGMGRNAIARELNVTTRQVDNVARDLGLKFSTDRTFIAARSRESRAAQDRSELAEGARREAHRLLGLLQELDEPVQVRRVVGAIAELLDIDIRASAATPDVTERENDPDLYIRGEIDAMLAELDFTMAYQRVVRPRAKQVDTSSLLTGFSADN